jgi:hypothetical protein
MRLVRVIDWLLARRAGVTRVCVVVLALLVVVDALPWVVDKEHAHGAVERWPGFWAVFGFIGCALLILVSKAFGRAGIMKREDYYDDE